MKQPSRARTVVIGTAIAGLLCSAGLVDASAPIYGGPTMGSSILPNTPGSTAGNGTGVGYVYTDTDSGDEDSRAIRWDTTSAVVLGNLGTDSSGFTQAAAYAVNTARTAVGFAEKYLAGVDVGSRAVRWDAATSAATELGNLGTGSDGVTFSRAVAINTAGIAAGSAEKYSGAADLGTRAVRWNASGTAATELDNLGTASSGVTSSAANDLNDAGTVVGYAQQYSGNTNLGDRAVRWNAAGAATALDNLSGSKGSRALAVNASGTAVGFVENSNTDTLSNDRAVRWDASGTTATELQGGTGGKAVAVNAAGTAVGFVGYRSYRWDAAGARTELQSVTPATAANGLTYVSAINDSDISVGTCLAQGVGVRAVAWKADGIAIDLNNFLSASDAGHWDLEQALDISNTDWISGSGDFDPDGSAGPQQSYNRSFLLDVISIFGTPGDATRNGSVNFDDLVILAQNYNKTAGATWDTGDFNGDGAVNFNDLVILAQHYNAGTPALTDFSPAFAIDWKLAQSLAPEPTTLVAGLSLLSLAIRRRR